ncbi:MAG TPA: acyl-CoA dehydrogenase family protein, partial [Chloroflexota bacterium]|nr:acyl-CoA dehydrogenase family protein [Chloroflexota bacterium]
KAGEWYAEGWRKMGQLGLLGLQFPEEYGGSGASVLTTAAAFQAFTAGGADAGIALSWVAHSVLAGTPIWHFGTDAQKRKYLTKIATGEWTAGYGLTEPGAGSDAASLQTTAVKKGDCYVLNGSKMFITNAPVGDVFVVFATEDRSLGSRGISAFIVERGFPGFSSGRELDKMGNRTSPTGELIFQDCEVPAENLLGESHKGFAIAKAALEWERFLMMAHSVGTMQAVLRDCLRYAKQRSQFGKPIFEQPAIQAKLANMQLNAAAGELFVRRVAWLKDQSNALGPTPLESSACKIFCSNAVMQSALQGVQLMGGYGYMRENAVERAMRDAKLAEIGGGTTEIQRQVVGRQMLHQPDQRWDAAYTPEQVAARCQQPSEAPDLVAAALSVAEQARRKPAFDSTAGDDPTRSALFTAATATGLAEAALDEALECARAIHEGDLVQLVEFKLADIRTRVDGARMLVHKAAARLDAGADASEAARLARIFAAEAAVFCAEQAASLTGERSARTERLIQAVHRPELSGSSLLEERLALARSLSA